ncbi:MAG: adenylosuccinate synthase [Anaerolineales bacterium]|nr:adenylosuccinate synthase [Anaerolineales bacterium]
MTLQVIVGAQWGDEGKGRIVDWFAAQARYAARFNGGDNAGHTVTVGQRVFKLHLIPSGILQPHIVGILGNGMVVNPQTLVEEMDMLAGNGIPISPARLHLSYAAQLITPAHNALDRALESGRGKDNIGTTGRGIGPAYTDKAARSGLRAVDMLAPDFCEHLGDHVAETNRTLGLHGAPHLDPAPICNQFRLLAEHLKPYITDTAAELDAALRAGQNVLAEGAQGTLLDIDHGTYPFVTSSNTTAPGALTGLGLGLTAAREARVSGVVKAFQTRVGSGPFPTEVSGELADRLRGSGKNPWDEFGTTTGRPRRVGWLDGVLLRYATRLNGLTELVITKLDILTGLDPLRVCVAYKTGQETLTDLPFGPADLHLYEPVYEDLPGWTEDLGTIRDWEDLPAAARGYLERLEHLTGVPVTLASVGPEREQVVEKR